MCLQGMQLKGWQQGPDEMHVTDGYIAGMPLPALAAPLPAYSTSELARATEAGLGQHPLQTQLLLIMILESGGQSQSLPPTLVP